MKTVLLRSAAAFVAALALLLTGSAGSLAASAAPAAPSAPADTVYGCPASGVRYLPYPDDAHKVVYCEAGYAYVTTCPADLIWNIRYEACDIPSDAHKYATSLATGTAHLVLAPLQVKGLNARLTWRDGRPLGGATLTFSTTTGTALCTARTDRNGWTSCDSAPGLNVPVDTLRAGYQVTYKGIVTLGASQARGAVSTTS
ncbi:carbohydrate-binding module family 14 protein [Streptomyces sp. MST-110588]|uniref:carbohydrate-binding module family 14 protein n=1 Tax=Streptomyces sp. MST-110588 TaxID=2833628 RepID=UPI001F5C35E6|nr:carbohydrate-binding module family 14 protein [Streptomyces sp. MST-110588]UNO38685.1 hypothetical protein KGS77_02260 [Streptomyces sp. MST-110588]